VHETLLRGGRVVGTGGRQPLDAIEPDCLRSPARSGAWDRNLPGSSRLQPAVSPRTTAWIKTSAMLGSPFWKNPPGASFRVLPLCYPHRNSSETSRGVAA
jgi:hypothetical protein